MKKIMLFTNQDSHLVAHLMPILQEALARGYDVTVLTNVSEHREKLVSLGIKIIHLPLNRKSLNLFTEAQLLVMLFKIIQQNRPDILHTFTVKPVIYGTIVAYVCRVPKVINTFLGMGYLFMSENPLVILLRKMLCKILEFISKRKEIIYVTQNKDDAKLLLDLKLSQPQFIVHQCSVGVCVQHFYKMPYPEGEMIFALVARMIKDKGVREFIAAAQQLKQKGYRAAFWLVGAPDFDNRTSLTEAELQASVAAGIINYLGHQNDVRSIWEKAQVAVLPSYREGLSRVLLEAAACGRAIITTNAPGGREIVSDGETGLLVTPKNIPTLAAAMERLLINPAEAKYLADNVYRLVTTQYSEQTIARAMVDFYS